MGGAAGHMKHPFDLPQVKNTADVVDFFERLAKSLRFRSACVKIDGKNASVRLNENNVFVLDRMSKKPLDIKGISIEDLPARFPEGHGFLQVGAVVLNIFNRNISRLEPILRRLGVWGDPTKMINLEYMDGTTNVIKNDEKFLAIHGLLQIHEDSETGRRYTVEIPAKKRLINKLAKKLNEIASTEFGFEVHSQFKAKLTRKPDFESVLNKFVMIDGVAFPLRRWIRIYDEDNFDKNKSVIVDGKPICVLSKRIMNIIINSESDHYKQFMKWDNSAACGAVMYYTTMVLGEELLRCMDSRFGTCDKQEGIVVRNRRLIGIDAPCKITGRFILDGMNSNFRKN